MGLAIAVASALLTLVGFQGGDETTVESDARDPDTNITKTTTQPPTENSGVRHTPRQPVPPTPVPSPHEPEPLICRVEGPFPNDDDCTMPPEPTEAPEQVVTPGDVLRETKRVGLPRLRVTVQPPGSTLVNLETIFHTTVRPFERSVTVLDSTVLLRATPVTYTWHHGDGTSQVSPEPGRPYPAMDVIHRYRSPGQATPSVDVTYEVTYRIDDGDWHELDTPITATGPTTALRIREARPVLIR